MSGFNRKDGSTPPAKAPEGAPADAPHKSGRTTFDDRGRAVWEWQVQTGSFDLNADSQRVRALTDVELSLEEPTPARTGFKEEGFSPYGSTPAAPAKRLVGANPYSTGAAKRPEDVSYDPHRPHSPPTTRPVPPPPAARPGANPYGDPTEPPAKRTFNPFNAFKLGATKKPPR